MKEYIVTEHPGFPYEEPKPQELVRCKDCMFYQTDKGGWCLDHDDDVLWLEDSYCSRAVRKDNGADKRRR